MDIFSKIAAGEIPSYKCAENDEFYAFLDINPLVKGHTLVIPRREVDYFFDMDDQELARYQQFAKRVALAVKKAFPCRKVAQVILGLEVAHAHIHLIPMQSEADADFRREKLKLTEEEFEEIAAKIQKEYDYDKCSLVVDHDDGLKGVIKKSSLGNPTPILFENATVWGVEKADEYLKQKYGDYMIIPDEEHQRQHNFHLLDLEKSYKDV